jgi:hypothetical protein
LEYEIFADVFIRRLSWEAAFGLKVKKVFALNEKTMGGTKQNGNVKGDQR